MRISHRGLMALQGWVIVAVFVGWNGLLLTGAWLNGWRSRINEHTPWSARLCIAAATLGVAALALSILTSPRARGFLLSPQRRELYAPGPYALLALVGTLLGVGMLSGLS